MTATFTAVFPIEHPLPIERLTREAYNQMPEILRAAEVTILGPYTWQLLGPQHRPRALVATAPATGTINTRRAAAVRRIIEQVSGA